MTFSDTSVTCSLLAPSHPPPDTPFVALNTLNEESSGNQDLGGAKNVSKGILQALLEIALESKI